MPGVFSSHLLRRRDVVSGDIVRSGVNVDLPNWRGRLEYAYGPRGPGRLRIPPEDAAWPPNDERMVAFFGPGVKEHYDLSLPIGDRRPFPTIGAEGAE